MSPLAVHLYVKEQPQLAYLATGIYKQKESYNHLNSSIKISQPLTMRHTMHFAAITHFPVFK